jgi:hypothetical protein
VRVSRDRFPTHGKPLLAINPSDPRNLLAACMVIDGRRRGLATYVSFDGGQSTSASCFGWSRRCPLQVRTADAEWARTGVGVGGPWAICVDCVRGKGG